MSPQFDVENLKHYPTSSGVYLMKNEEGVVLYVGKAINIRNRIKSYFSKTGDGREMVPFLTQQVASIEFIIVDSEKEALLLENTLIKKHKPKYNALLKDDKSYFSLMINHKHLWPMVRVVRYKGKPPKNQLYFGPYTNGYAAKQTLERLRKLFPLRQCSDHELVSRKRPCILFDMKQCIAPCVSKCTKAEYDDYVHQTVLFLRGKTSPILKKLNQEMKEASEKLNFEKAERYYRTITYIERTVQAQKVDQAGGGDYDVFGICRDVDLVVVTELTFREGKLLSANNHLFEHNAQSDEELISSFLLQHYGEQESILADIMIPIEIPEKEILESLLSCKIICPKKGNKRALIEMAEENACAKSKLEKETKNREEQLLMALEENCKLINYPQRIEAFDTSNLGGDETVSAMIVFTKGKPDKDEYRKYKLRRAAAHDDYAALAEVLSRRYKDASVLPDLILIDGGKGHLQVAINTLEELDITTVDLIAISKEEGRHDKGLAAEKIYHSSMDEPIQMKPTEPTLLFLQRIRDEAHRFAIGYQKVRRRKKLLTSELDAIPGIGEVKRKRLLIHFGSVEKLKQATPEQLAEVPGINETDVTTLIEYFKK